MTLPEGCTFKAVTLLLDVFEILSLGPLVFKTLLEAVQDDV